MPIETHTHEHFGITRGQGGRTYMGKDYRWHTGEQGLTAEPRLLFPSREQASHFVHAETYGGDIRPVEVHNDACWPCRADGTPAQVDELRDTLLLNEAAGRCAWVDGVVYGHKGDAITQ